MSVDDSSLKLNVGTSYDGSADVTVSVKDAGITNAMLAGSITADKLDTITTADKVSGSAIQLKTTGGTAVSAISGADGLQVQVDSNSIEIK